MNDQTDAVLATADRPNAALPNDKPHTGVGFTLYLALGLIALTLLMLVLALVMNGFTGPPGRAVGKG